MQQQPPPALHRPFRLPTVGTLSTISARQCLLSLPHYLAQLRSVSQLLVPPSLQEPEKQHKKDVVSGGSSSPLPATSGQPYRAPFIQRVQRTRRESRLQRYQQMEELQKQGLTTAQIAKLLGRSPRTIRRWLALEHFPEKRQRRRRPSLIDPYEPYVLMRGPQRCHNGLQIWREIASRGYSGEPSAFYSSSFSTPSCRRSVS
jgi:Homeodomain-like domain